MDPNNGQSGNGVDPMAKLEEDLQKLTNEAENDPSTSQPINNQLDNEEAPTQTSPQEPPQETASIVESTSPEVTPNPVVPPEPKKGSPMLIISLGLVVVALLAAIAYVIGIKFFSGAPKQIACTADAKVCDDGTSVGRSGPNCEFDACPVFSVAPEATPDPTADWKTYFSKDRSFSFKFPENLVTSSSNELNLVFYDSTLQNPKTTDQVLNIGVSKGDKSTYKSSPLSDEQVYTDGQGRVWKTGVVGAEAINFTGVLEVGMNVYEVGIQSGSVKGDENSFVDTHRVLANQILSTFMFTEATPSGSPTSTPSSLPVY